MKTILTKIPGRGYSKSALSALESIDEFEDHNSDSVIAIVRAGTLPDAIQNMCDCLKQKCPDSWRQHKADVIYGSPAAFTQRAIRVIMRYADHDVRAQGALVIAQRMKTKADSFESYLGRSVMN